MNILRLIAGVGVLIAVGLTGGNILLTSLQIGIAYTVLDHFDNTNTPRGT